MLWYYIRDVLQEDEFLAGLQEKAQLATESTGWEFAVAGLLDVNVYHRLATVGFPLGILPRGETICVHAVTHPHGVSWWILPLPISDTLTRCLERIPSTEDGRRLEISDVPHAREDWALCLCQGATSGEDRPWPHCRPWNHLRRLKQERRAFDQVAASRACSPRRLGCVGPSAMCEGKTTARETADVGTSRQGTRGDRPGSVY